MMDRTGWVMMRLWLEFHFGLAVEEKNWRIRWRNCALSREVVRRGRRGGGIGERKGEVVSHGSYDLE